MTRSEEYAARAIRPDAIRLNIGLGCATEQSQQELRLADLRVISGEYWVDSGTGARRIINLDEHELTTFTETKSNEESV